jgi:hypothetical protein
MDVATLPTLTERRRKRINLDQLSHLIREPLRTSSLKEGEARVLGE